MHWARTRIPIGQASRYRLPSYLSVSTCAYTWTYSRPGEWWYDSMPLGHIQYLVVVTFFTTAIWGQDGRVKIRYAWTYSMPLGQNVPQLLSHKILEVQIQIQRASTRLSNISRWSQISPFVEIWIKILSFFVAWKVRYRTCPAASKDRWHERGGWPPSGFGLGGWERTPSSQLLPVATCLLNGLTRLWHSKTCKWP